MAKETTKTPNRITTDFYGDGDKTAYIKEEKVLEFARKFKHLRRLQKKYNASRDRGVLDQAKKAEGDLDYLIDRILRAENHPAAKDDLPW